MARDDIITLTVHGLDADNQLVRADVFARKLSAFVQGLVAADRLANGKRLHTFIIEQLKDGSAVARVREKQKTMARPALSAVQTYDRSIRAIYNGERAAEELPQVLVASIRRLSTGTGKLLKHAEVTIDPADTSKVIRIDEYLLRKTEEVLREAPEEGAPTQPFYRGTAIGGFDGTLEVLDGRGQALRAKLITTAGRMEIDCVVPHHLFEALRDNWERRVRIEGTAHYEGDNALPSRIDVLDIRPLKAEADLLRWRGAFRVGSLHDEAW
jgi:hypothetical protein